MNKYRGKDEKYIADGRKNGYPMCCILTYSFLMIIDVMPAATMGGCFKDDGSNQFVACPYHRLRPPRGWTYKRLSR